MDQQPKPDHETQLQLEELFNKNQTLPRLKQEFMNADISQHCNAHQIPLDFAIDLLAQMVLHKRATAATLIGLLGPKHFAQGRDSIPSTEELQACADMLFKAAEADLIHWNELGRQFIIAIDVTEDIHQNLERYQYPLPLVVKPKQIRSNRDTGYHSPGSAKGSVILRNNHHKDDVCLDHLNRVNQMKLTINTDTVRMVKNQWKNLDHKKVDETQEKFQKRLKAFEKFDRSSKDVIDHLTISGNEFYLTHRYDKRGRCYAQGYHVNPQGNDWSKAIIEFARKEHVR